MTPDQISALTAIAAIVSKVGTWPLGSVIAAVVFGPWVFSWMSTRSMEKRHAAVVQMYEDNCKLVKNYEKVASEQADTIRLSTSATIELTTFLQTRVPCHERINDRRRQ
jgi:hypothetical protein